MPQKVLHSAAFVHPNAKRKSLLNIFLIVNAAEGSTISGILYVSVAECLYLYWCFQCQAPWNVFTFNGVSGQTSLSFSTNVYCTAAFFAKIQVSQLYIKYTKSKEIKVLKKIWKLNSKYTRSIKTLNIF